MGKLIAVVSLSLLLFFGVWYGQRFFNNDAAPAQEEEVSSGEGVFITGPSIPEGVPVLNIMGRVLSISGDTITITAESPIGMSDDPSLKERTVTLTEATVVSTFTERDPELVKKEIEDLKKRIAENERVEAEARAAGANIPPTPAMEIPDIPPVVYEKQEVGKEGLAVGRVVSVMAETDIRTMESFIAISIDIIPLEPPR